MDQVTNCIFCQFVTAVTNGSRNNSSKSHKQSEHNHNHVINVTSLLTLNVVFVRQIHMNHIQFFPCSPLSFLHVHPQCVVWFHGYLYSHKSQLFSFPSNSILILCVRFFFIFLYFWTIQSMCLYTPVYSCIQLKIWMSKS